MDQTVVPPNAWAVLVAALLTFVIGGLWYSPLLFARAWQSAAGLTDEQLKQASLPKIFGTSFACALIGSVNLGFFLGGNAAIGFGAAAGFAVGFGWIATAMATTFLFERRPMKLLAIDAGYHVVTYTLMGLVLGAWH